MMLLAFFIIYKSGLIITLHYGAKKLPGSEALCVNGPSSMLDITHHLIRLLSVSLIGVNGIVLAQETFHGQHVRPSRAFAADKLSVQHSRGHICTASWVQLIFEDVNVDCNERFKKWDMETFRDPVLKRSRFFPNRQITKHVA